MDERTSDEKTAVVRAGPPNGGAADDNAHCADGRVVQLNVGGRVYATYASTLRACKDGLLARMLDGGFTAATTRPGDPTVLFVDRDGDRFAYVLDYLRQTVAGGGDNIISSLPADTRVLEALAVDADYMCLPGLTAAIRARLSEEGARGPGRGSLLPHESVFITISQHATVAVVVASSASVWGADIGDADPTLPTSRLTDDFKRVFSRHPLTLKRPKGSPLPYMDGECGSRSCFHGHWTPVTTRVDTYTRIVLTACACSMIDAAMLIGAVVDIVSRRHRVLSMHQVASDGATAVNLVLARSRAQPMQQGSWEGEI